MSKSNANAKKPTPKTAIDGGKGGTGAQTTENEVEVLYQKMGDRWFAFSMVGDEVFVGSISQDAIDSAELDGANSPKNLPEA